MRSLDSIYKLTYRQLMELRGNNLALPLSLSPAVIT